MIERKALAAAMAAVQVESEQELGERPWTLEQVPPRPHAEGTIREIGEIATRVLGARAERFMTELRRWRGPEPYPSKQQRFLAVPWKARLDEDDVEQILRGVTLVLRDPNSRGRVHLVMRDHHTLDALLYLYDAWGWLPHGPVLHLDRHSDFEPIVAWHGQANGWWSLLPFLQRPSGEPIIHPKEVIYGTALEADVTKYDPPMPGELNGAHAQVPLSHEGLDHSLESALARAEAMKPDFVSVDLDLFMPEVQFRLAGRVLEDSRYRRLIDRAPAALFVLSPQFARGGDSVPFVVQATHRELARTLNLAR